jgi:hypothetical protein
MEKCDIQKEDMDNLSDSIKNILDEKDINFDEIEGENTYHIVMKDNGLMINIYIGINDDENAFTIFASSDIKIERKDYINAFEAINEINEEDCNSSLLIDWQSGCIASTRYVFTDGPITDLRYLFEPIESCADILGENAEEMDLNKRVSF